MLREKIMTGPKVVCLTDLDAELRQAVAGQGLAGMEIVSEPLGISDGEQIELVSDADYLIIWPAHISDDVLRPAKKCR